MAIVYVENRPYQMDPEQNLLHGCLSLGFDLPYFCWHPALGSVGACRQCAVKQYKDAEDTKGRIVMACMTPAAEGARISIADAEAAAFRRMVIEGLMQNHPHDCPVCDEGGECHLQDMTVMTGHDYRRYSFDKRTWRNQNLGPLVNHEMNRCIQCYRCVRYYRDYAGGRDLQAFGLRDTVFFGRNEDGVLESEFSGNLVEICPTGVFTDKTERFHYTRKWDQTFAPSICTHCGLGCNTDVGARYGTLRRVLNRYNHEINGYFLCDRGRFGYEFVHSTQRLSAAPPEDGRRRLHALAAEGAIGIGSPRASLESNFALRELVGPERFYAGVDDLDLRLLRLMVRLLRPSSIRDVEQADAVLVLGEDLPNTAPRLALAVRQSVRQQPMKIAEKMRIPLWLDQNVREAVQDSRGPLFIATPAATRLDDIAARTIRGAPDEIARLGAAIAGALDPQAPEVPGLDSGTAYLAGFIAEALRTAERPMVIAGPSLRSEAILRAAADVARALRAGLVLTAPECNSIGLALLDPHPIGEAPADVPAIILENDLRRRGINAERWRRTAVLDCLETPTTRRAELALAVGSFAESDGTFVNNEGRAQRFFQVIAPPEARVESWRLLGEWGCLDQVLAAMAEHVPALARVKEAAPGAGFRMAGERVPRQSHRFSGRTAMLANISVHEPKPPADTDSPLAFSMEGAPQQPPPSLVPFFWSPGWNSIQSVNKFQEEIAGPLRGGPAGVRLVEPQPDPGYLGEVPPPFQPGDHLLPVPLYEIFGSDELSAHAPAIASLAPQPYAAMNPDDAARVGPEWNGLPVRAVPEFPRGVAGVYAPNPRGEHD